MQNPIYLNKWLMLTKKKFKEEKLIPYQPTLKEKHFLLKNNTDHLLQLSKKSPHNNLKENN
jgi:hypothetical protein